jgi:hypothetical protein
MTKKSDSAHFRRTRKELAEMLGYEGDPDALPVAQAMRLDVIHGLKVGLDAMRAKLLAGEPVDNVEMRQLADTLERFLPAAAKPESAVPALYRRDPYKVMEDMVARYRAAAEAERSARGLSLATPLENQQARIDELEAELAELRGVLPMDDPTRALPAPEAAESDVIDVPTSAITPPGERSDLPRNQQYWNGKPLPPGAQIIDGKLVPIPPVAKPGHVTKAQADAVNARRDIDHAIMTSPSRVAHEPVPSTNRIMGGVYEGPFRRVW